MPPASHVTYTKDQVELVNQLPSLSQLVHQGPLQQARTDASKEAKLLELLAVCFGSTYDFTGPGSPSGPAFVQVFQDLVTHRVCNTEWRTSLREDHLLRVLQAVRLFTRDVRLRKSLLEMPGALEALAVVFSRQTEQHLTAQITPFQVELLTELASISKRLAADESGLAAMVAAGLHISLMNLVASTDPAVLPLVLVALIGLAAHREYGSLLVAGCSSSSGSSSMNGTTSNNGAVQSSSLPTSAPAVLHILIRIVAEYDLPFKRLAADLLALLARRDNVVPELLESNCVGRLVGQLSSGDAALTASLLRLLCYCANDVRALQDMYQTGTIPVLLSLVSAALKEADTAAAGSGGLTSARITDMQLVCTCLTRLSEDDELAGVIRTAGGVALLGRLLLATPAASDDASDADKLSRELCSLHAYVLRALRFLFSMERNRKVFKRLFPPDFFAAFIDIGHYNASLAAYLPLAQQIQELNDKARAALSAALDDITADRDGAAAVEPIRTLKGGAYLLVEVLGKGAYGAVYKARRSRGDALVAIKEIPLSDVAMFGGNTADRDAGVSVAAKEVDILSSMSHPHVVQYYESFVEGQHLYIAMELVEGVSLMDHLNSLIEKNKRMPEQDIWQVLLAVLLALHYVHSVAKVVHRDLTPANIMLGHGVDGLRHAKIADFGLAKRMSGSVVTAQSLVGTMPYTCPEIIQQEQYSEKADVWSLGCVLYHCMALKPPFDGTNPLSVASKIVEGSYEPVSDPADGPPYSSQLKNLQRLMMTVDPDKRPNSSDLGALVSAQLMSSLERLTASEQRLQRALALEKAHHRRGASAGMPFSAGGISDIPPSPSPQPILSMLNTLPTHPSHTLKATTPAGTPHKQQQNVVNNSNVSHMDSPTRAINATAPPLPAAHGSMPSTLRMRRHMLEPLPVPITGNATPSVNSPAILTTPAVLSPAPSAQHFTAQAGAGAASMLHVNVNLSNVSPSIDVPGQPSDTERLASTPTSERLPQPEAVNFLYNGSAGPQSTQAAGGGGGLLGTAGGPGTPGRLVSLATSRLRPMQDPLAQILGQLHKVMWLDQLPPGLTRDPRRRALEVFKRLCFGPGTTATSLKVHLAKLQVGDADVIRDAATGRVLEFGSAPLASPDATSAAVVPVEGTLTYEQLGIVIEMLLQERGYWSQQQQVAGGPGLNTAISGPSNSTLGGNAVHVGTMQGSGHMSAHGAALAPTSMPRGPSFVGVAGECSTTQLIQVGPPEALLDQLPPSAFLYRAANPGNAPHGVHGVQGDAAGGPVSGGSKNASVDGTADLQSRSYRPDPQAKSTGGDTSGYGRRLSHNSGSGLPVARQERSGSLHGTLSGSGTHSAPRHASPKPGVQARSRLHAVEGHTASLGPSSGGDTQSQFPTAVVGLVKKNPVPTRVTAALIQQSDENVSAPAPGLHGVPRTSSQRMRQF